MKNLHHYLKQTEKDYEYILKFSKKPSDEEMDRLELYLKHRYDAVEVGTPKKLKVQKNPRDFRNLGSKIDPYFLHFKTRIPTTNMTSLVAELSKKMGIHMSHIIVQSIHDPLYIEAEEEGEDRMEPEKDYKPRLSDPDYSEHDNPKAEDYFGDDYNKKFVKKAMKSGVGQGFEIDSA